MGEVRLGSSATADEGPAADGPDMLNDEVAPGPGARRLFRMLGVGSSGISCTLE